MIKFTLIISALIEFVLGQGLQTSTTNSSIPTPCLSNATSIFGSKYGAISYSDYPLL